MIEAGTNAILPGANVTIDKTIERAHNVHGFRAEANIESEVENGNSNGFWGVYAFPGDALDISDLPVTWANFDDEKVS